MSTASRFLSGLFVVVFLFGAGVGTTRAQDVDEEPGMGPLLAPNAVYAEALGNGFVYSLNYERLFNDRLAGRFGLLYAGGWGAPLMANFLVGRGRRHLEVGLGVVLLSATHMADDLGVREEHLSNVMASCTIGYRYQDPAGGLMFRVGFTPLFSYSFDAKGLRGFGASLGYSF